jgi:hypothetical protein
LEKSCGKKAVAFTEKWTTSISSGTTLAPESDKRPAVSTIAQDFDVIES